MPVNEDLNEYLDKIEAALMAWTIDRSLVESYLRGISVDLYVLVRSGRLEDIAEVEDTFAGFENILEGTLKDQPENVALHYLLGRIEQIMLDLGVACDRSISNAAIKQLKGNPLQRRIIEALGEGTDEIELSALSQKLGTVISWDTVRQMMGPFGLIRVSGNRRVHLHPGPKGPATLRAALEELESA